MMVELPRGHGKTNYWLLHKAMVKVMDRLYLEGVGKPGRGIMSDKEELMANHVNDNVKVQLADGKVYEGKLRSTEFVMEGFNKPLDFLTLQPSSVELRELVKFEMEVDKVTCQKPPKPPRKGLKHWVTFALGNEEREALVTTDMREALACYQSLLRLARGLGAKGVQASVELCSDYTEL